MQRLHTVLLKLKMEKLLAPRQCCLIKGHMALLILYTEQGLNVQNCINRLLEQVNKLNADESKLPVLRTMVDTFDSILNKSDIFINGNYLFFGENFQIWNLNFSLAFISIYFISSVHRHVDCGLLNVLLTAGAREMLTIHQQTVCIQCIEHSLETVVSGAASKNHVHFV